MSCNQGISFVDQYRIDETELGDRLGDLVDLLLGVLPGVSWIGTQIRYRAVLYPKHTHVSFYSSPETIPDANLLPHPWRFGARQDV